MKNKQNFTKTHRTILTIGLLFFVMISIAGYIFYQNRDVDAKICAQDICFDVEIANTSAQRQKGLMFRDTLPALSGMIFVFPKSDMYNFWMKNTILPLDMIRIDENQKIVKIITAKLCTSDPCPSYSPGVAAKYVLELNAGSAEQYGLIEGKKMKFVNIY